MHIWWQEHISDRKLTILHKQSQADLSEHKNTGKQHECTLRKAFVEYKYLAVAKMPAKVSLQCMFL